MPVMSRRTLGRTLISAGAALAAVGAAGYGLWPRIDAYRSEAARQRRLIAGEPSVAELVRMATLAASGHNAQPWRFHTGGGRVSILPDFSRRTPVVDPDDHHLFVSLGCAAENLSVAAAALGRGGAVGIGGGAAPGIEIALSAAPPGRRDLYRAIPERQSTRSLFDGRPVSPADLALLEAAAREDGVSVLLHTSAADRDAILEFVIAGNGAQIDDPAFVRELRDWIRFSPARALETGDGLFATCSGAPVVPEWLGRRMFSLAFTKGAENDKLRAQVRTSAGIAVFVADKADPAQWIRVGRSFQRFALQATALGVRTAHLNQAVEVPAVRDGLARWLGAPGARPDLVIRFGSAPLAPMSLRRAAPVGAPV